MEQALALIGFGEAASALAGGLSATLRGYDRKTGDATMRAGKLVDFERASVAACETARDALTGAEAALSLVTADQALAAAHASNGLPPGAFWFDMNSVAPDTKREAAAIIESAGGRYVDVAVMAPVNPKQLAVPLLLSGSHASAGATLLHDLGFRNVTVIDGAIGAASAIKMIRSIMVKGIEALSAECAFAADAAGVRDEVIASLDASWPGADWAKRLDYNLDRMLVHGVRRAAEMDEVVKTLDQLGIDSTMSRDTAARQRTLGNLSIAPPDGLHAKLTVLAPFVRTHRKERVA